MKNPKVQIEVSARHIHLSQKDFEKLYGKNSELHPIKNLSQEGEFSSKEIVEIVNGKEKLNVRILGPFRKNSQAELAITDAIKLKLNPLPKLKVSGDLDGTTKVLIKYKNKSIKIPCIIAQRHLHCSPEEAKKLKLKNNQILKIKIPGKRGLIFDNVVVRVNPKFRLSVHLDTDEGNSAGVYGKTFGEIIK
jgi:propanediol utilization protein